MPLRSHADETYDKAPLDDQARSVAHLFLRRVEKSAARTAFQYFVGEELHGVTWTETKAQVFDWAAGLIALGIEPEQRVAIAAQTRYEWVIADLAIMCAGAATTTVYASTSAADVAYLVSDSGCRIAFAEDAGQVEKLRVRRGELPELSRVICFVESAADGDWVIGLTELLRLGRELLAKDPEVVDRRVEQIGPDSLATIIYTSGTTGQPKGAELTHRAFTYKGAAVNSLDFIGEDDTQFLWLPLAHIFGKVLLAIAMDCGCTTAVDGRLDKIVDNLAVVKPTWMGAAPRIFEKARGKVMGTFEEATGVKRALIDWSLGVGRRVAEAEVADRALWPPLKAQHLIADKLVLSKVRERFGGRVRFFISGSAPLDPEVGWWFASLGMLIIEGYGLTETSAATCVNRPFPGCYDFGTIGWPVPGTDLRIDPADGELLVRGPGVMRGYHHKDEATAEVMTEDGFFRTGDVAEIDARGFVRITDRKKDVFKTSGGKYIAPSRIEAHFKGLCPMVSQFLVVGEGKNYASALVTLDEQALEGWAASHGMAGKSYAEVVGSEAAHDMVQGYIDTLNAGLNRWETIKRFEILPRDLSVDGGELTPSLKVRRARVLEHFSQEYSALYDGSGPAS